MGGKRRRHGKTVCGKRDKPFLHARDQYTACTDKAPYNTLTQAVERSCTIPEGNALGG